MPCVVAASKIRCRDPQSAPVRPFVVDVVNNDRHPNDEEVAAFLDDGLAPGARDAIARHLVACEECRALLGPSRAREVLAEHPRPRRHVAGSWRTLAGVAAAAVVVISVALRTDRTSASGGVVAVDSARALRAPGSTKSDETVLQVESPADGATVLVDTLVLRWTRADVRATYDVSIVDATGSLIWSTQTDTASTALPSSVRDRLEPGATYHWRVDALLPDLRTMTTGPRAFVPSQR